MIVEFNIFYLQEEQMIRQDSGKIIPLRECSLKKMAFVNIDNFTSRIDTPEFTIITSGGEEFITNESYAVVMHKIQQASIFKFN
jgi:hypothetical protein